MLDDDFFGVRECSLSWRHVSRCNSQTKVAVVWLEVSYLHPLAYENFKLQVLLVVAFDMMSRDTIFRWWGPKSGGVVAEARENNPVKRRPFRTALNHLRAPWVAKSSFAYSTTSIKPFQC